MSTPHALRLILTSEVFKALIKALITLLLDQIHTRLRKAKEKHIKDEDLFE